MSNIKLGQKAPIISLYNTQKTKVSIGEKREKNVVLLFFPLAFTGVCTKELCTIRDTYNQYEKLNAEVFGISVDSVFCLEKFKAEQNINFDLLSDFNKEASKAYDVLYDVFSALEMKGVSKRAAFIIDRAGMIIHKDICAPEDLPNFDLMVQVLKNR